MDSSSPSRLSRPAWSASFLCSVDLRNSEYETTPVSLEEMVGGAAEDVGGFDQTSQDSSLVFSVQRAALAVIRCRPQARV